MVCLHPALRPGKPFVASANVLLLIPLTLVMSIVSLSIVESLIY